MRRRPGTSWSPLAGGGVRRLVHDVDRRTARVGLWPARAGLCMPTLRVTDGRVRVDLPWRIPPYFRLGEDAQIDVMGQVKIGERVYPDARHTIRLPR